jgi:uncharacterized membrane protein
MRMLRLTGKAMVLAFALASPSGAFAGLEICNDTAELRAVAIGYDKDGQKVSEGWWSLPPGGCKTPLVRDLSDMPVFILAKGRDTPPAQTGEEFCTTGSAFTIVKSGDCAAQGHVGARFRAAPAGQGEADIELLVSELDRAAEAERAAGPDNALFRSCEGAADDAATGCVFHADGIRYDVSPETPAAIRDYLGGLDPAAPLLVRGQIAGEEEFRATIVLSEAATRDATAGDRILAQLQGDWVSANDPSDRITITGAERSGSYDGTATGTEVLSVRDRCGEETEGGPFLQARDGATGDVYCYGIETLSDTVLSLTHLPRGNLLEYRREE